MIDKRLIDFYVGDMLSKLNGKYIDVNDKRYKKIVKYVSKVG